MTAPSRTATTFSGVTASQAITFSSGGNVDATHGAVMLIRRQSSSGSVNLLAGAAVSGWTPVGSHVSTSGTARVAVLAFYRLGDASFAGGTFTATNSVQTNLALYEWASIHQASFVSSSDYDSTAANTHLPSLIDLTSVEDGSTLVGFAATSGTAGGSGFVWGGGSGWSVLNGGSSSSSLSTAYRTVNNGASSGADAVAWTTSGIAAGVVLMLNTGVVNVAPTVDAGTNQNVAAGTVNLTATPADSDGTIASTAWTFDYPTSGAPSYTGGTTSTPSFTAGAAPQLYIHHVTVTDDDAATGEDTVETRVPVSGSTAVTPLAMNGTSVVGTMTNTGGAATDGAALADASDATYIESGTVSGTEQSERYRINPSAVRASGSLTPIRLATDTGTATAKVRLYEGSTLREQFSQAITTTITDYTFALAGATISAITDWGNLYIEIGFTS